MTMPADSYRDDAPGPGSTVWYATGLGWRVAEGGTLASGWIAGDPDGDGTPSTGAEEQVSLPASPAKKNNDAFSAADFGSFPTDFRGLTGFLCGAQSASQHEQATTLARSPETASEAIARLEAATREKMFAMEAKIRAQQRERESQPRTFGDLIREHFEEPIADSRQRRLAERISWLEYELLNLPSDGMAYQVHVGPDHDYGKSVGVHIPAAVVQQSIRVALADMVRERDALARQ